MSHKRVAYIFDDNILKETDRLPMVLNRASIVHDLIVSYGLLDSLDVTESIPATEDDLKLFHSTSFIEFLKIVNESDDLELFDEEQVEYGFGYDCALLERNYDLIKTLAGGSLTAANVLIDDACDVAINWFGGWHHAERDTAEGFCYVNDIVIAIQKMLQKFKRILYVDLDIHHGNGVQNAFEISRRVLTLSFHKFSPGFYPGTGDVDELGMQNGKYYSINVPLLDGISDVNYLKIFRSVFTSVHEKYKPEAIVVQCGADGIFGDPLGESNLTLIGIGECVRHILHCEKPTLFLGGGGYNNANAARLWAYLTSIIVNKLLSEDIPDESEFFTEYGPSFELHVAAGNQKDTNTKDYVKATLDKIAGAVQLLELVVL